MALVRYALPPAEPPALTDCRFYHSIELPGIGLQQGYWDLRGGYDDYFGGQDFSGERVLDIGTSSGALAFEIERRGASEVVAFDLDEGLTYDRRLSTAETVLTKFRAGIALVSEGQRRIAVIVEPAHPARIGPLLMSAYGLTDREQDVTRLVLQGESTAAIADRLVVSVHTVNSTSRASSKRSACAAAATSWARSSSPTTNHGYATTSRGRHSASRSAAARWPTTDFSCA